MQGIEAQDDVVHIQCKGSIGCLRRPWGACKFMAVIRRSESSNKDRSPTGLPEHEKEMYLAFRIAIIG